MVVGQYANYKRKFFGIWRIILDIYHSGFSVRTVKVIGDFKRENNDFTMLLTINVPPICSGNSQMSVLRICYF